MNHKMPILVNVGCGNITHPAWINVDMNPVDSTVKMMKKDGRIPLGSNVATACYSSHVLEHIPHQSAVGFLLEQKRVLHNGGIIRVVVPNLSFLCEEYLREFNACMQSTLNPTYRYEHTVAELLDQLVRTPRHYELVTLWRNTPARDRDWVAERVGYVAAPFLSQCYDNAISTRAVLCCSPHRRVASVSRLLAKAISRIQECIAAAFIMVIGGRRLYDAFECGVYRSRGEIHQWMYDAVSLRKLLADCGFTNIEERRLGESSIPGWQGYELEIRHGVILKPHSLVLEARKP